MKLFTQLETINLQLVNFFSTFPETTLGLHSLIPHDWKYKISASHGSMGICNAMNWVALPSSVLMQKAAYSYWRESMKATSQKSLICAATKLLLYPAPEHHKSTWAPRIPLQELLWSYYLNTLLASILTTQLLLPHWSSGWCMLFHWG